MEAKNEAHLNESTLEDNHPVYWDYLYVADGKVVRSDIQGTIRDLKRDTGAKQITSCDIEGRRAQMVQEKSNNNE